jgi:two-component system CheB/CheR fusion protein
LFESLAQQYGEHAIGVVLSGGGSDGAAGVRQIKNAGGIVLVQDPDEAESNAMPRAAVGLGDIADLILPAEALANELVRLSQHPFFKSTHRESLEDKLEMPSAEVTTLFQLLRRTMGVDFTHYKPATVQRRIRRRMALHRLPDLSEYVQLLQQNPAEIERLHDDILIHVTSFFRDPDSFESLSENILPTLIAQHQDGTPIRVWVPGCSSGEETYSLAMTLLEALPPRAAIPLQVFGTDVSHKMIARARAGVYPAGEVAGLPAERVRQFFVNYGGEYRVSPRVRESCVFARQDLTRDPPFSKLDLVWCRNLLIYLGPPLQRRAIELFHYALNPGGYLVLGRSETVGGQAELFEPLDAKWKTFRRRTTGTPARDADFTLRQPDVPSARVLPLRQRPRSEADINAEASRILVERYAPASIVLDESLKVRRTNGRTSRYLELPPGEVSLDALKLVRPGLSSPLRSALAEAKRQGRVARRERLSIVDDEAGERVSIEVTPLGDTQTRYYLVQFEESGAPSAQGRSRKQGARVRAIKGGAPGLRELEEELDSTRHDLQAMIQDLEATNEELQSANEEILSSNEELQSMNEELDTAREELQSTNEELSTVNDELQGRNMQLTELNGDLLNLLASVQIPIVMVSADLRIRRFTPAAERMLNLLPSDIGRPIAHIKPNISCPDLEGIIREVVDTVSVREREVPDNDGNVFLLRVRPYKTVDNRIDGAVLALFEISTALKLARETGEELMARLPDAALLVDARLVVQSANPIFYGQFGGRPEEFEGRRLFEVEPGWGGPELRTLLESELPAKRRVEGFRVTLDTLQSGRTSFLLDARYVEHEHVGVILLILKAAPPLAAS